MYVNPLLDRLNHTDLGAKIGKVICNTSACADDVTLNSFNEMESQVLIDTAAEYAKQERYQLQHSKTNSIRMHSNRKQNSSGQQNLNSLQINGQPINDTKEAPHIGLLQSDTIAKTMEINVEQNIKKSRRTTYSLMTSGLHGYNGLDAETTLQLFKTYVLPILVYGMEILLPTKKNTAKMDIFQKRILKQILPLPTNTPDCAVYILTGIWPVELQIQYKALIFL